MSNQLKMNSFDEIKSSINKALEEIKKQSPELYKHLKESIVMNETEGTFMYAPTDGAIE